jgi:hypothetical protein
MRSRSQAVVVLMYLHSNSFAFEIILPKKDVKLFIVLIEEDGTEYKL